MLEYSSDELGRDGELIITDFCYFLLYWLLKSKRTDRELKKTKEEKIIIGAKLLFSQNFTCQRLFWFENIGNEIRSKKNAKACFLYRLSKL